MAIPTIFLLIDGRNIAFLSPEEWEVVILTLTIAVRSVLFGLPVAVLVSWLLVRERSPRRPVLDAVAYLRMVLPPVVVGWLLLLVFGVHGAIGAWLQSWFGS
jgi:molybdate transport system permease protein